MPHTAPIPHSAKSTDLKYNLIAVPELRGSAGHRVNPTCRVGRVPAAHQAQVRRPALRVGVLHKQLLKRSSLMPLTPRFGNLIQVIYSIKRLKQLADTAARWTTQRWSPPPRLDSTAWGSRCSAGGAVTHSRLTLVRAAAREHPSLRHCVTVSLSLRAAGEPPSGLQDRA